MKTTRKAIRKINQQTQISILTERDNRHLTTKDCSKWLRKDQ